MFKFLSIARWFTAILMFLAKPRKIKVSVDHVTSPIFISSVQSCGYWYYANILQMHFDFGSVVTSEMSEIVRIPLKGLKYEGPGIYNINEGETQLHREDTPILDPAALPRTCRLQVLAGYQDSHKTFLCTQFTAMVIGVWYEVPRVPALPPQNEFPAFLYTDPKGNGEFVSYWVSVKDHDAQLGEKFAA